MKKIAAYIIGLMAFSAVFAQSEATITCPTLSEIKQHTIIQDEIFPVKGIMMAMIEDNFSTNSNWMLMLDISQCVDCTNDDDDGDWEIAANIQLQNLQNEPTIQIIDDMPVCVYDKSSDDAEGFKVVATPARQIMLAGITPILKKTATA